MNPFANHKICLSIAICVIATVYAVSADSSTLKVPAEFPTIQSAVVAAVDGDTILVAPGTYYENIYIDRTALHLLSEAGPELTIIDGSNLAQVIRIVAVPSSIIEGFTIQNGNPGSSSSPAGVWIESGFNITIRNNIVRSNTCDSCVGLGIGLSGYQPGPVLIENNIIENNSGPRCGGGGIGATIAIDLRIENNVIRNNECNVGGGIYLRTGLSQTIINNNVIMNNSANLYGGGIWTLGVSVSMTQNLITGNVAEQGGGVYADVEDLIGNSTIYTNNTFANNTANGSEVYFRGDLGPYLNKTITLANNSITNDEGLISFFCDFADSPPILQLNSNNVYSMSGPGYGGSCSDIYTGVDGNLSAEPLYIDAANGEFQLESSSPMIDAGNNSATNIPAEDLDGHPRIIDGNLDGVAVVDMGAYEQQGNASINISIDIKPRSFPNSINPSAKGVITVAVLTTDDFDALQVDLGSVRFGPAEAERTHKQAHVEDVDYDGDMDLVVHFRTQETGIQCGDTEATLTGETFDGQSFAGIDSIRTVNCKLTLTFTPVEWTIARDTHGAGIHTIYMIADVSPLVVDDLQDIGGELIWEETQITLCADPTYPPVEWGKFISIRDVGDGFLRIGDGFQSNGQGPGCDINTTMQNAFDNFGLPEKACLSVRSGDINYEFCAPLNIIQ